MRMSDEQDNKMEVDGEMVRPAAGEPSSEPFKDKYRDLKSKLKFLVYEHECFEVEVQRAQAKLLELSHDKSFLLDQLMRYEPVLVSDDEEREELTDLSASEDELLYSDLPHGSQPSPLATPTMKSSGTPTPSSILQPSSRSLDPSRQAISKATAIGNKQGRKQGGKNKVNSGTAVRIAKAVNRARQTTTTKPMLRQVNRVKSSVSLVVSLPRPSTGVHVESEGVITVHDTHMLPNVTQDTPAQSESPITNHTTSQPPTLTASQPPTLTKVTLPSSTLGALPSSSSSSTTTSSGDSDSDESTSSSSETRNTTSVDRETATSPVQMVSEAKSSVSLLRPKAITSPVKSVPPNTETAVRTPPPLLSPLLSPTGAQMGWTKHPSDLTSPSHVGFVPLAPPLNSPTLPFSSLGKPHKSAFQLVSPRRDSTSDHTQHTDGTA